MTLTDDAEALDEAFRQLTQKFPAVPQDVVHAAVERELASLERPGPDLVATLVSRAASHELARLQPMF